MTEFGLFPAEIVVCTLGTRGDFQPFLEIAAALKARGHDVTILSNANWQREAEDRGLQFVPIAPRDQSQSGRDDRHFFLANTLPSFRQSYEFVAHRVATGAQPLLVYRSNMVGVQAAAQRLALRAAKIFLQPSALRSHISPPWPMSVLTKGPIAGLGRSVAVPALYTLADIFGPYRRPVRQFRRAVGVPTHTHWRRASDQDDIVLLLCPRWFAMPQPDWPARLSATGFVYAATSRPNRETRAFVAQRGAPIIFTPGTGVTDTVTFFEKAADCLRSAGSTGIFLSRNIPEKFQYDPDILCKDYLDLGAVLPLAKALFHHGGVGTAAQAFRAGIPQIILPGRFDQPDNAIRTARLGLGAAILSERFTGDDWAGLLQKTLETPHIAMQLNTAKRLIAADDGLQNAVASVELMARSAFGAQPVAASAAQLRLR
jgi:rhamnosyltransferase subunit B